MHHAFKANLLAASQDALNRSQSQPMPNNSQASFASELLGFSCHFFFCHSLRSICLKLKLFYSTSSAGGCFTLKQTKQNGERAMSFADGKVFICDVSC